MDLWVDMICEPQQLLLCWEAPVSEADRNKWVVGRLVPTPSGAAFSYLSGEEFLEINFGRTEGQLKAAGYLGYPAFDPKKGPLFSENVLEAFMRRLPPRSRPDFSRYLEQFRVRSCSSASDLFLLGATEARLPSDGFSLINPLDPETAGCDVLVEIAGYRHYLDVGAEVMLGCALTLVPNPENEFDRNAVRFQAGELMLGHVARFQAVSILAWLESGAIDAYLVKKNGTAERPKAFALLRYRQTKGHRAAA